jgi:hypothetical protein
MQPMKWTRSIVAVVALLLLAAPQPLPGASTLSELRGIEELKSWFNASKARPRLIFLLSPT